MYNKTEYNFYELIRGHYWEGAIFRLNVNDQPKDLTGATIDVWFRRNNQSGKVIKKLTTGAGITILDAVSGEFQIDGFSVDFEKGYYYYDVKITFPDGKIKYYIYGQISVLENGTD